MQGSGFGFCCIVIRCTKSVGWFEQTLYLDAIHALPDDVKILIRYLPEQDLIPFVREVSRLFPRAFVGDFLPEHTMTLSEEYPTEDHRDRLILYTETEGETLLRLALEAEQKWLVPAVSSSQVESLSLYTKHLDTPHGRPGYKITQRMSRLLRKMDVEFFLERLFDDAVTKLSTMIPIQSSSLISLRSFFIDACNQNMDPETPCWHVDSIQSIFQEVKKKWYVQDPVVIELSVHCVLRYFAQYLIKQSEMSGGIAWSGAYIRVLPLFLFGRFDETSAVFGLPTEIACEIARLVVTW